MANDKILSSDNKDNTSGSKHIASGNISAPSGSKQIPSESNGTPVANNNILDEGDVMPIGIKGYVPTDLKGRIKKSTENGGLKGLHQEFDDKDGDWVCIQSPNPFEVLYLDYKLFHIITPEIVKSNYNILEKFWKNKYILLNTGGNRVAFKKKYGDNTIENSLNILKNSFDKISTTTGIENYFIEINNKRLIEGENRLKDSIEDMLVDGVADKSEIGLRIERGLKYDLTRDEVVNIIKKAIDLNQFKPYGNVTGESILEQLLSVDWMCEKKLEEQYKYNEEVKKRGREIFTNRFAFNVEDIGDILFSDEKQANEYISEGLIVNSIDYFSVPKAKKVKEIINSKKDQQSKYLQISYFLNPKLSYNFENINYSNLKDLTKGLFNNPKQGKEHLKKGYIEIWLQETQTDNYQKLLKIRDTAKNIDLAFLEFLYTFNPELPYRFNNTLLINSPKELCSAIDKNTENWVSGGVELINESIIIWLETIGKTQITDKWKLIKEKYKDNNDAGLEYFLHLLNDKLEYPLIAIDKTSFSYPAIQSGDKISTNFILTNKTRGFIDGNLEFSKKIVGVSLSKNTFNLNIAIGISTCKINLTIDSDILIKSVDYKTNIYIRPETFERIEIPVSFKLVFPKNAFIKQLLKCTIIFALFGGIIRTGWFLLGFKNWIKVDYPYYLSRLDVVWQPKPSIYFFPLIFLLMFIIVIILIINWQAVSYFMDYNKKKSK